MENLGVINEIFFSYLNGVYFFFKQFNGSGHLQIPWPRPTVSQHRNLGLFGKANIHELDPSKKFHFSMCSNLESIRNFRVVYNYLRKLNFRFPKAIFACDFPIFVNTSLLA